MRIITSWARRSNERAVANARAAATAAGRRRVEAAEVAAFLAARERGQDGSALGFAAR